MAASQEHGLGAGHCLCGAVRFDSWEAPLWQGHCHCESCRRACAAPFTSFFGVANSGWRWTGAAPQVYASSPGVERLFCPTCGTPMAYRAADRSDRIFFYAATLEHPERFTPEDHCRWEEHLPWIMLNDTLPR